MRAEDAAGFLPEDYAFTSDLLCRYATSTNPEAKAMFQAVCSNNLSIILAALDAAAERKP